MIREVVDHLDDMFGSSVTDLVVNATVISRSVDAVFRSAPLHMKPYAEGAKILLQIIYSRVYRESDWKDVVVQQSVRKGVNLSAPSHYGPEVKSLIGQAFVKVMDEDGRSRP